MSGAHTNHRGRRGRIGSLLASIAIILLLLVIIGTRILPFFPRAITPASAPDDVFSAGRASAHLPIIAAESHPSGSTAQQMVRDYLEAQLAAIGLETEVQQYGSGENVVGRLEGSSSTGAVVVLAHYDSVATGPGAADNGAGVAALLEAIRVIAAGHQLQNDIIVLFDDGEEQYFVGAEAFVREHRWMNDVRVAVSLDTAINGPVLVNETGSPNGRLVDAMAVAHSDSWLWASHSGGGTYDTYAFREAGIQALSLEDNYAFREQHTGLDRPEIVNEASLQQLGDQTVAVTRELGGLDLDEPWGEEETFFSLPLLGLVHYPQSWSLPLALIANLLFATAMVVSLRKGVASRRGLVIGLAAVLGATLISGLLAALIWSFIPGLLSWDTGSWPMWPEVIPSDGAVILTLFVALVLAPATVVYIITRRFSSRAEMALMGLAPFAVLALVIALTEPRAAYLPLWPALIGSAAWLISLLLPSLSRWTADLPTLLSAVLLMLFVPSLLLEIFIGSGLNDVAVIAALWALLVLSVSSAFEAALGKDSGGI